MRSQVLAFQVFGLFFCLLSISCSTASKAPNEFSAEFIQKEIVLQDISGADPVPLFEYLGDKSLYAENTLDASKLALTHQQIYRALAFGETLKTQVAVRRLGDTITAVLDESSISRVSGFLQLNLKTKKLVFNFGPEFGAYVGQLTHDQFARAMKKMKEIESHHSLTENEPFQFYYDTAAVFRSKHPYTYVVESGELKTFFKNKNESLNYQRDNQKHRCGTDLFWVIFEMVGEGRAPASVMTP